MPVTPPLPPDKAPEAVQAIYERIKETIGGGQLPVGFQMMGHVEAFLSDNYNNYKKYVHHEGAGKLLDGKQRAALALATSSAMNCVHCVRAHAKDALAAGWTDLQVAEILAVTATCAMYNTYFKFKDLSGDAAFEHLPPGLRAFTFQKTSLGEPLVELICVVVSNINGCKQCTTNHVQRLLELGVTHESIDEAIKVSATMASFNTYHRTQ
jgi:alkyl hydroperoxide reductase subunit D